MTWLLSSSKAVPIPLKGASQKVGKTPPVGYTSMEQEIFFSLSSFSGEQEHSLRTVSILGHNYAELWSCLVLKYNNWHFGDLER